MAALIVPSQLAEQIYAIAEQEQRSVEDILASMVKRYVALNDYDLSVLILKAAGVTPLSGEDSEPPLLP